jgi:hypothetical protein
VRLNIPLARIGSENDTAFRATAADLDDFSLGPDRRRRGKRRAREQQRAAVERAIRCLDFALPLASIVTHAHDLLLKCCRTDSG